MCIPESEKLEIGMNLQVASNCASLLGTLGERKKAAASEPSMNCAQKWHEAGSKRIQSRL